MPFCLKQIAFILLMLIAEGAMGQITFEGCVDYRGIPVASIDQPVQDVAMATYAPSGEPIIIYNPQALSWLSPPTRLFFYAHECAHHVLGHAVRNIPFMQEQEADCWAVQQIVSKGLLSNEDVNTVQGDIAKFGKADWTHLPGSVRAINLRTCLASSSTTKASDSQTGDSWDTCYDKCQVTNDRCTDRCVSGSSWDSCYDRCQRRFDSCSNRCQ